MLRDNLVNFLKRSWPWLLTATAVLATGFFPHDHSSIFAIFGIDDLIIGGVGALGSIAGGIFGSSASASERQAAAEALAKAAKIIEDTGTPPDQSMPIVLQQFQQAGILTPQLEQNIQQQYSKMAGTYVDPQVRQAQQDALEFFKQRGTLGLGPEERAAFNKVRQDVARDAEAKRQQIIQNMQARHMGGAGAELAAQLSAAQSGNEIASEQGDRIAAAAAQNALSAMSQYGSLGSQMRGQEFSEASQRARAEDEMNRFNTQSQQAVQQRNIASQNAAQQFNLSNAQQISNANVGQANQELYRQQQAARQFWLDKLNKAGQLSNVYMQSVAPHQQNAQRIAEGATNVGAGIGQAIGTGATYLKGQPSTQASAPAAPAAPQPTSIWNSEPTPQLKKEELGKLDLYDPYRV